MWRHRATSSAPSFLAGGIAVDVAADIAGDVDDIGGDTAA